MTNFTPDHPRFIFVRPVYVNEAELQNQVMHGTSNDEPVTINRNDIEAGKVIFLQDSTVYAEGSFNDDFEFDMNEMVLSRDKIWLAPENPENTNGFPFHFDAAMGTVAYLDDNGVQHLVEEDQFHKMMRIDDEGRMICRLSDSIIDQEQACEKAGATKHLAAIAENFTEMKLSDSGYLQKLAYSRDILHMEPDTGYTTEQLIEIRTSETNASILKRSQLDDRTSAQWMPLANVPTFANPHIRAIFNHFMKDRLKDFPTDQVGITSFQTLWDAQIAIGEAFPDMREFPPFDGGSLMPNYRTGTVFEYTDGKMTVITFEDRPDTPVQAYAYPNELTLDADVTPETPGMTM